jgi:hypothetical protein
MDSYVYRQLLEDASLFEPKDNHRVVDIFFTNGDKKITDAILTEKALRVWINKSSIERPPENHESTPHIRLLICSARVLDRNIWPLPISSKTTDELLKAWSIPTAFLRCICRQIPIAISYTNEKDPSVSGLLFRTNLSWVWQYALAIVHNSASNTTDILLMGLRSGEADIVVEALKEATHHTWSPFAIPCILMDKAIDTLSQDAEQRRNSLLQICYATGLHGFGTGPSINGDDHDELDLDLLMHKLTALTDACAGIGAVCKTQNTFIQTLRNLKSGEQTMEDASVKQKAETWHQHLDFLEQLLAGIESKITYTRASAQGQVQTMYSLISQRDNRTNIESAEASRRIADDSRKVALLTRKDSTDMRTISAVTLVFLPATFTATFFSTSFFNLQPTDGYRVSRWIWLYWVITVLLTVAVLFFWLVFVRLQHRKTQETLRRESRRESRRKSVAFKIGKPEVVIQSPTRVESERPYLTGSISGAALEAQSK